MKLKAIIIGFLVSLISLVYINVDAKQVAKCSAKKVCGNGGEVSCEGSRSCETTYNGVKCDDVTATCN